MRRTTADYLAPRLCPDHIIVGLTPVPGDAIAFLRSGLVWNLAYDKGRLLGNVSTWDLMADGHHDLLLRSIEANNEPRALERRVLLGESINPAELVALDCFSRIALVLAHRCAGGVIDPAEVAALEVLATTDSEKGSMGALRKILAQPIGTPQRPLNDDPIQIIASDDVAHLDLYDYVSTGDREGCLRRLATAVAQAKAPATAAERYQRWPQLASLCRLLTDDYDAAMRLLEQAPLNDVRDDWRALFGPLGEARIQRAKDVVLSAIERAFDGVIFPGSKHRSLYQAEAADNYAGCDQSRDHKGRWQDLPREHILACQYALPHLHGASLQYYLPAIMSFVVREHDLPTPDHGNEWIFESMEYHLRFSLDDVGLRNYGAQRHQIMTLEQLGAIACFADYYRCRAEDRARWHTVARGAAWPAASRHDVVA